MKNPKTPNFNSWITLQPSVKRAAAHEVYEMLLDEAKYQKRPYILMRLISAYLSKERATLRKAHIKPTKKKAKP